MEEDFVLYVPETHHCLSIQNGCCLWCGNYSPVLCAGDYQLCADCLEDLFSGFEARLEAEEELE